MGSVKQRPSRQFFTDTVELIIKTLSSHLITQEFNSPVNSSPHLKVALFALRHRRPLRFP
eukprot:7948554-Pyramimonas_sp.AAC.1